MTAAEIIQIVQLVERGVTLAMQAGLAVDQLLGDIREAREEGRQLTDEQIDGYARAAATAVERL